MPSLSFEAAVTLFTERAAAVDNRFRLTAENESIVAYVCRRVDGIPLAIELAAARVQIFTPEQLAQRLDERFRLLAGGRRDALPRQQTLFGAIDWSYRLLDERKRTFFGAWPSSQTALSSRVPLRSVRIEVSTSSRSSIPSSRS